MNNVPERKFRSTVAISSCPELRNVHVPAKPNHKVVVMEFGSRHDCIAPLVKTVAHGKLYGHLLGPLGAQVMAVASVHQCFKVFSLALDGARTNNFAIVLDLPNWYDVKAGPHWHPAFVVVVKGLVGKVYVVKTDSKINFGAAVEELVAHIGPPADRTVNQVGLVEIFAGWAIWVEKISIPHFVPSEIAKVEIPLP